MIKINENRTRIKGSSEVLLSELTYLMHNLITEKVAKKDDLLFCVNLATKSDDEIKRESKEALENMIDDLITLLKDNDKRD